MFRRTFVAMALGGFLLIGGCVASQASDHRGQCEQRVRKAEANLRKEVERHGERSHQAEQRRRELEKARASCRGDERGDHHEHDYDHR